MADEFAEQDVFFVQYASQVFWAERIPSSWNDVQQTSMVIECW